MNRREAAMDYLAARWAPIALAALYVAGTVVCSAVVVATRASRVHTQYLGYRAVRPLSKNHFLVAEDLTAPDSIPGEPCCGGTSSWALPESQELQGRYLTQDVKARGLVRLDSVSAFPELPDQATLADAMKVILDVASTDEALDAGSHVVICGRPDDPCIDDGVVLAVVHPKSGTRYVVVQVPSDQAAAAHTAAHKAELRLRVVSY